MENASNISQEEVIYKFDHQDSKNADLPMLGVQIKVKDLKPVKAILERTPNFPRTLEGSEPPRLRVVFKRNQPLEIRQPEKPEKRCTDKWVLKLPERVMWQKQWSSPQKPFCQLIQHQVRS